MSLRSPPLAFPGPERPRKGEHTQPPLTEPAFEGHAAAAFRNAALHTAHQAGDTDRSAGIQSVWLGQAAPAIEVLDHALTHTQDSTARSLLQLRKASAHAMAGEARACRRALDAAEHALNTATATPPAWCSWMSPAVMWSVNLFQSGSVSRLRCCLAA
ncbi:hypothetical protein [Streptomyces atratus]|uniref:hypothetical protein n=1 Tax=Streptomyces atratus TaxID=1893 RepID=UPI00225BFD44|nr:hypothetical protein [Streptomyces atratus]MCX5345989.1 hypothetical protein [Streptomyces atratus]